MRIMVELVGEFVQYCNFFVHVGAASCQYQDGKFEGFALLVGSRMVLQDCKKIFAYLF